MTAQCSRPAKSATVLFTLLILFSLFGPNLAQIPLAEAANPVPQTLLPNPAPDNLAESQRFSFGAPKLAVTAARPAENQALTADQYQGGEHLLGNSSTGVGKIQARGEQLVDVNGARYFVAGINYEGPIDRAWTMWNNDKFDPTLIGHNLAQAATGGYNSVRIFIQDSLKDDIRANNWGKLDTVADLAQQNGLRLLITFLDYYEPDLNKVAEVDRLVARHFAGSPVILGYDLRNEPQLPELMYSVYPGGSVPLQTEDLIRLYGERMSQSAADAYRTGPGLSKIPSHLNSRQVYIYLNLLKIYDEFQNDVYTWVVNNPRSTDMDYYSSYDSMKWNRAPWYASNKLPSQMAEVQDK